MATKNDIINTTYGMLSEEEITDLDISNSVLQGVKRIYDHVKVNLLSEHDWKFATKWNQITKTQNKPVDPAYSSEYHYPQDCLKMLRCYPWTDFERIGQFVYCNISTDWKWKYTYNVNESEFPEYFSMLLIYSLAKNCAGLVTGQESLMQIFAGLAEEQKGLALYLDASSEKNEIIQDQTFLNARHY